MGMTWLIRGTVAVVFAVLVGAWAVGVSGIRDSPSPKDERPPASRDESIAPEFDSSVVREKAKSPRTNKKDEAEDTVTEPGLDAGNVPPSDAPVAPAPENTDPTPDAPGGSQGQSDSPQPPSPSDTPNEPSDECTDLLSTVGCALDPVVPDP